MSAHLIEPERTIASIINERLDVERHTRKLATEIFSGGRSCLALSTTGLIFMRKFGLSKWFWALNLVPLAVSCAILLVFDVNGGSDEVVGKYVTVLTLCWISATLLCGSSILLGLHWLLYQTDRRSDGLAMVGFTVLCLMMLSIISGMTFKLGRISLIIGRKGKL